MEMFQKKCLDDLAVMGGPPAFKENLYVGRPNIGDRKRFIDRVNDILDRRWLTNDGRYVQEFEEKLAVFLGVRNCISMCNATIALEIAIRALGMKGEVIIPSFTFIATAHSLQWQEITPVFCDIDPVSHTIDPQQVEEMITPRTTGIIGVHIWGRTCSIDDLVEIARHRRLKLLFDAAHAFGCSHGGQRVGRFGDAEVFSFHATKFFNTFEGGAITTNDDDLAKRIRLMKNFGFAGNDNVIYIGTNGKMTEVAAAMGLSSFESLEEIIEVNRRNYYQYLGELSTLPGVKMMRYDEREECNYQYIVLEINETEAGIDRDSILQILQAENVFARRYFYPGCHRMEPYKSYFPHAGLLLPHTNRLVDRVMSLPTGTAVGEREIDGICTILRIAVTHGAEIRGRLPDVGR